MNSEQNRPEHGQSPTAERVVLLDEAATPIGTADKVLVHNAFTPLHLAFSCYLFDLHGNVLVTRRALAKPTWPGVWTNSFCGHPAPGEAMEQAVRRRARQELGAEIDHLRLVDSNFRYTATDASGMVENEVCPVFTATIATPLNACQEEVAQWVWLNPTVLAKAVALAQFAFSPWLVLQLPVVLRWAKHSTIRGVTYGSQADTT